MVIATVPDFLGYVAKVEADAAAHFDDLARAMNSGKADDLAKLFSQLAGQSRIWPRAPRRRPRARMRTSRCRTTMSGRITRRPESDALWAGDATLSRLDALKAALLGERRCYEFYVAAEATAKSPEVAKAARPFIKAEGERVKVIEAWITREEWAAAH